MNYIKLTGDTLEKEHICTLLKREFVTHEILSEKKFLKISNIE